MNKYYFLITSIFIFAYPVKASLEQEENNAKKAVIAHQLELQKSENLLIHKKEDARCQEKEVANKLCANIPETIIEKATNNPKKKDNDINKVLGGPAPMEGNKVLSLPKRIGGYIKYGPDGLYHSMRPYTHSRVIGLPPLKNAPKTVQEAIEAAVKRIELLKNSMVMRTYNPSVLTIITLPEFALNGSGDEASLKFDANNPITLEQYNAFREVWIKFKNTLPPGFLIIPGTSAVVYKDKDLKSGKEITRGVNTGTIMLSGTDESLDFSKKDPSNLDGWDHSTVSYKEGTGPITFKVEDLIGKTEHFFNLSVCLGVKNLELPIPVDMVLVVAAAAPLPEKDLGNARIFINDAAYNEYFNVSSSVKFDPIHPEVEIDHDQTGEWKKVDLPEYPLVKTLFELKEPGLMGKSLQSLFRFFLGSPERFLGTIRRYQKIDNPEGGIYETIRNEKNEFLGKILVSQIRELPQRPLQQNVLKFIEEAGAGRLSLFDMNKESKSSDIDIPKSDEFKVEFDPKDADKPEGMREADFFHVDKR